MKGFRDFLVRGNLLELAVAFIMGAAFGDLTKSFSDLIMSIISRILGGTPDFSTVTVAGVNIGEFISSLIAFLLIASVLYWCIVKPMSALRERFRKEEPEVAVTEMDVLVEIRDLLATQKSS
ncbi:MAG: large conductance mechanosensitive channel protein MscL [Propionibacteriaceae bacterium]|nr:large conductance mechanosensitive channel protein MscL [Propionibacteriaceae bacterium]